jgi:hypothetical protein
MKFDHVPFVEATGRVLGAGHPYERRVEIQAVDLEAMMHSEKIGVFASTAGDIEYGAAARVDPSQQVRHLAGLRWVILEARVDQVVEVGGFAEHVGWAIMAAGLTDRA